MRGVPVTTAVQRLMAMAELDDPFTTPREELEPLWIDAINQRFQEARGSVKLLDQLAENAGTDTIKSLDDVVPLLFAHTAYKSYPESFIDKGQWDRMCLWLSTLSKHPVEGVNLEGVNDADDWIARLHEAGHPLFATSGTTGKNSFLNQSPTDVAFANTATVPNRLPRDNSRPIFILGPRKAPNRASATFNHMVQVCGRPDAVHFLSDAELRITDLSNLARYRLGSEGSRAVLGSLLGCQPRGSRLHQRRHRPTELRATQRGCGGRSHHRNFRNRHPQIRLRPATAGLPRKPIPRTRKENS